MSEPTANEEARAAMVADLRARGVIRTPAVERAMAAIPRHQFVANAEVASAYADVAIVAKRDPDGTPISSASQPTIVAAMLEMGRFRPGHRVLEIGTGTGYNAALVATLVEPGGRVVSVELDRDLATEASGRLLGLVPGRVEVITADGASGHPDHAPYDRVIVTTGAPEIAPAWVDQLRLGGRLVVPVVGPDGRGLLRVLVKRSGQLDEVDQLPCGFLPMRSPRSGSPAS